MTSYLQRIASAEERIDTMERTHATRSELNTAFKSQQQLYKDVFEENLALRERLWRVGASAHTLGGANTEHDMFATRTRAKPLVWEPPRENVPRLPPVRLI